MEEKSAVTRSIKNYNSKLNGTNEIVVDLDEITLLLNDGKKKAKVATSSATVLNDECDTNTDNTDSQNGSPTKVSDVQVVHQVNDNI